MAKSPEPENKDTAQASTWMSYIAVVVVFGVGIPLLCFALTVVAAIGVAFWSAIVGG